MTNIRTVGLNEMAAHTHLNVEKWRERNLDLDDVFVELVPRVDEHVSVPALRRSSGEGSNDLSVL